MSREDELEKAIAAHVMWKTRLKNAIDSGRLDADVQTIARDDQCTLGKWLYGNTIAPSERTSGHYETVRSLHADFHKTAARVAELALAGKKAEAEAMMALRGEYSTVSGKLLQALTEWKAAA